MDKYTYSMKAEKIQKLVKKGDYEAAVKIADTVDWEEVHSVRLLTITAAAYENTRDYRSAIELLQLAYEESAVGKRILYKLTGLAIAEKDVDLAQHYYEMYLQEASDDNGRYLLRYLLAELKKEPLDKRIAILETYRKYEFEEEWALRLAQMYDEAGMGEQCVELCDEIILWFGVGDYVDEAMALKEKYAPLSAEQQDHRDNREYYAARYQEVVDEYTEREAVPEEPDEDEVPEEPQEQPEVWPEQIMLVDADGLEDAVQKSLEKLARYYRMHNKPMGKLTRISAERFNRVGFEASREHTKGKDLLIDNASSLSEELLSDIVHSVKYEQSEQIFVLADKADQLAYLDTRLGEFLHQEELLPKIKVSEVRAEDVLAHMSEKVEDELSDKETMEAPAPEAVEAPAGSAPEEEAPKRPDLLDADVEQLSFNFDKLDEPQAQNWDAAAGAVLTQELPKLDQVEEAVKQAEAAAEPSAQPEPAVEPEPAAKPEMKPAEEPAEQPAEAPAAQPEEKKSEAVASEGHFSFTDFLDDQHAAFAATAVSAAAAVTEASAPEPKKLFEDIVEKATEPAEEAVEKVSETAEEAAALAEEKAEEAVEAAEKAAEAAAEPEEPKAAPPAEAPAEDRPATKELPLEEIRENLERPAEKPVTDDKTVVMDEVRKPLEEAANKNLEGPTKVVSKIGTATGSIGAISMSEEGFITYAKNYLTSIDCILDDAGELALQNAAESRKEKGVLLTKEEAENMIEEAADMSERKGGLFSKRYNKEGLLILKGKFIK
nr:hypothetical protein [Lachnospiraceae bacterium]